MMHTIHKILIKYPIQELVAIGLSDFRLCLSYLLRSPAVPHLPSRMIIDPINKCNLQCPFCYTGAREPGATKSEMSYECFEHIIGLNPRVNSIDLYNWGEPLLNRDIFRMLDLLVPIARIIPNSRVRSITLMRRVLMVPIPTMI